MTGQPVHSSKQNIPLNQHRHSKPIKILQPLWTRTPGSNLFHIIAFLSEAKLSQSYRYSGRYRSLVMPNIVPSLNNTQWLIHISHSLNDEDRAHQSWAHFCLFSTSLHPSHNCTIGGTHFLCCFSICLQRAADLLWRKGESSTHLSSLGVSKTYFPLNLAVIWISPSNIYLVSVYEQVWLSAIALHCL